MWRNRPKTQPRSDAAIGGRVFRAFWICFLQKRYYVARSPTKWPFYSGRRFLWLSAAVAAKHRPAAKNDKNGKQPITGRLPHFLFPSLKQILHSCIQSRFHTLFHHLQNKGFHHCLLFFLTLLIIIFLLAHFTVTTLLNVMLEITVYSTSDSAWLVDASFRAM